MKSYAEKILAEALETLKERGEQRDSPNGERSMARTVAAFNALTGHGLSTLDGWEFMLCLKLSRSREGVYNKDDFLDLVGYTALLAEEAELSHTETTHVE